MFYSGDDMMNMYEVWILNPWRLGKSLLFIWMPAYRPLGGVIYRVFYAIFGFHNLPLYVFCWLLLAANTLLSYPFFRSAGAAPVQALFAVALTLVHGSFQDLYLSAGTIYDRLWFLFTVLGLIVYARVRGDGSRAPDLRSAALVCLLCIFSMDSKESGIALPVTLACYEALFILPGVWRADRVRAWLRAILPLYVTLAVISLAFVFGRVHRTPELTGNGAYQPHASAAIWLSHMAEYFTMLAYGHVHVTAISAGVLLLAMLLVAVFLRNPAMIFGWLFFVIALTPVALISSRPGYVLYVPDLGLGLYFAVALGLLLRRVPRFGIAVFATIAAALMLFHIRNWPGPFPPEASPEKRLTEQFRRELPTLPVSSKLLFVNDDFPVPAYDLTFNLRLMYHDQSIRADRMGGPPDQRPNPAHPVHYDHVFAQENGRYLELDNRNFAEAVRLRILRDYAVARELDFTRRDHSAYIVSGLKDGDAGEGRWTMPRAVLKFDLYPAPATFTAKWWVPDFVAKPVVRNMAIVIGGQPAGVVPLTHSGMNEISFPVSAAQISLNGFTLVELNVDKPYRNAEGEEFGVVLMRAGFAYR